MKTCFNCGRTLDFAGKPGRGDECPGCGAALKCCVNCRFYDPYSYNECSEPQADRVLEKDRANYCEYFEFRESGGGSGDGGDGGPRESSAEEKAKEALKKLFGE
ncbi:MAG: hypothetical protein ACE5EI_10890 [Thermodesulfobacteriota bacterium]